VSGTSREELRTRYGERDPVRGFVGVGSNVGDRAGTIRRAAELIGAHPEIELVASSGIRETEPWGPVEQPPFLNGVVAVETSLGPRELLDVLLELERRLGRVRGVRWGPRTIDLDLLLYDDAVVDEPGLTVPHPRLHERRFVLEPLAELDPGRVVPGRGTVADLLGALDAGGRD